jgi:hypothetical protein
MLMQYVIPVGFIFIALFHQSLIFIIMALDSKFQMVRFRTNGQIIKITLILLILPKETLMLSLLGLD